MTDVVLSPYGEVLLQRFPRSCELIRCLNDEYSAGIKTASDCMPEGYVYKPILPYKKQDIIASEEYYTYSKKIKKASYIAVSIFDDYVKGKLHPSDVTADNRFIRSKTFNDMASYEWGPRNTVDGHKVVMSLDENSKLHFYTDTFTLKIGTQIILCNYKFTITEIRNEIPKKPNTVMLLSDILYDEDDDSVDFTKSYFKVSLKENKVYIDAGSVLRLTGKDGVLCRNIVLRI